jgi:hypothetical protein
MTLFEIGHQFFVWKEANMAARSLGFGVKNLMI